MKVITGLERISNRKELQNQLKGNVGYLCHNASIDSAFNNGVALMQKMLGKRLVKLFGPQHGFVTDVQDNMVETKHYTHPYFNIPVYSLYSETRIPTDEMLSGLDTLVVDLQDVGTRVYTYISTLALLMDKLHETKSAIRLVIFDRPNPVGGKIIEGPVLEMAFKSFVGQYPIPQRHSMTMGEVARFGVKMKKLNIDLKIIEMENWNRSMYFQNTNLPWVLPSPNLPTAVGALTFVGTVLIEGTNLSEGRGTTRPLEVIGHPAIEPFSFVDELNGKLKGMDTGAVLRPIVFCPTFQKHAGQACGGVFIHPTDYEIFRPWAMAQFLVREFKNQLQGQFEFHQKPYEYEHHRLAIDLINGNSGVREWVLKNGDFNELETLNNKGHDAFLKLRNEILIYE